MDFKNRLRELHAETGKNLKLDAELSGVSYPVFWEYMNDKRRNPCLRNVLLLARHYDVSTDYLLGVTDVRRRFGQ